MSNVVNINAIESALIQNDLSKLTSEQRVSYYKSFCESVGLNPLTQPLSYIVLNGRLVLYAKKDATDQLRSLKKISITRLETKETDTTYEVIVYGKDGEGREDSDMGVVDITGLKGVNLANAKLKCVTKAKRRLTLSLSGLGLLDETEIDSIEEAKHSEQLLKPSQFSGENADIEALSESPGKYIFTFGKYKGQRIKDIPLSELQNYLEHIYDSAKKQGKELQGQVLEAVEFSEAYMKERK